MTADEIRALPAGRELDALIAEKVIGLVWQEVEGFRVLLPTAIPHIPRYILEQSGPYQFVPDCSTDIAAAWEVIEHMHHQGYWCQMRTPFDADDGWYWAGFTPHSTTGWNGRPDHWTEARTLPLAICRAALATMEARP